MADGSLSSLALGPFLFIDYPADRLDSLVYWVSARRGAREEVFRFDESPQDTARRYSERVREIVEYQTRVELRPLEEVLRSPAPRSETLARLQEELAQDLEAAQRRTVRASVGDLVQRHEAEIERERSAARGPDRPPTVRERSLTALSLEFLRNMGGISTDDDAHRFADEPPDRPPALAPRSAKLPTWRPNR